LVKDEAGCEEELGSGSESAHTNDMDTETRRNENIFELFQGNFLCQIFPAND
jgi:hypothetical protein